MPAILQLPSRIVFFAVFGACAILLISAVLLQTIEKVVPCPMCIMQRYAFLVCGLIALAAALHNPQSKGQRVWGGLLALAALTGGGVAARQSWLQWFPPTEVMCGPDLAYMVNAFPLGQWLPMLFNGDGDCSKVDWAFLGLSLANWGFLLFAGLAAAGIFIAWRGESVRKT